MRKLLTALLLCSTWLSGVANPCRADDYILINNIDAPNPADTATAWNLNQPGLSTDGQIIGYDPGNTNGVPTTAATSGYAVSPFTLTGTLQGGATTATVHEIQAVISLQQPTNIGAATGNVYGAFFTPGAGNSLSNATLVGGFFQFNVSPFETNGVGNGTTIRLVADPTTMPTLNAGQTYWLVIAPKAGLNAQTTDALTDYAVWNENSFSALQKFGISNATSYGTINPGLYEQMGAQAGDVLTADTAFFGTEILATASSVPETSTLVTALLGMIPIGMLLRRRLTGPRKPALNEQTSQHGHVGRSRPSPSPAGRAR